MKESPIFELEGTEPDFAQTFDLTVCHFLGVEKKHI